MLRIRDIPAFVIAMLIAAPLDFGLVDLWKATHNQLPDFLFYVLFVAILGVSVYTANLIWKAIRQRIR